MRRDILFYMAIRQFKQQSYQQRGIHGNFDYEFLLSQALVQIQNASIEQNQSPEKYINAVKYLYNLWMPKAMKDDTFIQEVSWYQSLIQKRLAYKIPKNATQEQQLEQYLNFELPLKNADLLFKAVMKSIERLGLMPKEKVAIEI